MTRITRRTPGTKPKTTIVRGTPKVDVPVVPEDLTPKIEALDAEVGVLLDAVKDLAARPAVVKTETIREPEVRLVASPLAQDPRVPKLETDVQALDKRVKKIEVRRPETIVYGGGSTSSGGGTSVWGGITGTLSDQTDLQSALNGKESTGVAATLDTAHVAAGDPHPQYLTSAEGNAAYSSLAHTHPEADITGLVADLAGKAALVHTHAQADITNLVVDLAAKQIGIQLQDEGSNLGASGTVTNINFTGAGVTASRATNSVTVNIPSAAPASVSITEVEVDFGSSPVYDKIFTIVDVLVSSTSKILISESGKIATGRVAQGDSIFDTINVAALPGTGSLQALCRASPGPVVGRRLLQYMVA